MNSEPAHQSSPKVNLIGVISPVPATPFSVKMLDELTRQLGERGYLTLLLPVDAHPDLLQKTRQLALAGLICLEAPASNMLAALKESLPYPVIPVCSSSADAEDSVSINDHAAAEQIGRLLADQPHQRFGYLQGRAGAEPSRRLAGYIAGLQVAGQKVEVLTAGDSDRESAYQAMMRYLKQARASERINALFCENDLLAFGAMQAIRDFGQGAHIGVAGFDDSDEAGTSTWHLTSWAQPYALLVTEALNRLLENRREEEGAWREGELRIRHSHLAKAAPGEMAKCGCASRH
ncbi:substrate-binding domain-containing protein [Pantoea sp. CCBC3-3-1]|uniref:substrate-binding domain-containing protein n=1 Tax=Pantoea sp. CCBC3-3-1 TaxID=2490851 RepID=UPI0011BF0BB8|nr:substrate-binding domain-containing protein [Pantoea sp. CCBC3-3-1]